jgi:Mg-chelatase subunit ChlD
MGAEDRQLDAALGSLYEPEENGTGAGKQRKAGLGEGKGRLSAWLGDIRALFDHETVVLLQQDAIERKGLRQLLLEPETLSQVVPSVEMVGTLLSLKEMIPESAKEAARGLVRAVAEEIARKLAPALSRAVRGALRHGESSPRQSLRNLDWARTLRRNLRHYQPAQRRIIPEKFLFHARQQRQREWTVIVCLDQSGSMVESAIYGAVMGSILASLPALETRIVAFDTEVVDLSAHSRDPVDVLFGVQLGGGTDINRAVHYCRTFVRNPRKTFLILISDLIEGGNSSHLVQQMETLVAEGARVLCLLALSDQGAPAYEAALAERFRQIGVPCGACAPAKLPALIASALQRRILTEFGIMTELK